MKSWNGSDNGGGSGHSIPTAAKKVVQNLREIVKKHSDDEIYAALKDCDMEPNHAVHILMNQDAFHEVKRRRVKRWEIGSNNDAKELKDRGPVGVLRSDCGAKSANGIPRHVNNGGSAGAKQKLTCIQEDNLPTRGSIRNDSFQSRNGTRNLGAIHRNPKKVATAQTSTRWTRLSQCTDSGWVCGTASAASCLYPSIDTNTSIKYGAIKRRAKPAMGLDRTDQKQEGGVRNLGVAFKSGKTFNTSMDNQKLVSVIKKSGGSFYNSVPFGSGEKTRTFCPSVSRPYYLKDDSTRVSYQSHHHGSNIRKALEWKRKPPMTTYVTADQSSEALEMKITGRSPPSSASLVGINAPTELISCLDGLKLLDEPSVFIPEHLRVPDAECIGLDFGSFDTDFDSSFRTKLRDCKCLIIEDTCVSTEVSTVEPLSSSMADGPPLESNRPSYPHLLSSSSVEASSIRSDAVHKSLPIAGQTTEISKPDIATQGRHLSFVSSGPSDDEGLGLGGPQLQYLYDIAESQPQEVPRPNFVPFADPSPNYISAVFRPGLEAETCFQFLPSHSTSKVGGNSPSVNAQTLISQESQSAGMPRSTLTVGGQPSIPVHAYAGAQPGGATIPAYPSNIYSYQYVPSNFAYMHAPYQASFTGNGGYLQPPVGTNFSPSGRVYHSAGSAAAKFPPPQYKLGVGSTPHTMVAAGYGSYQMTPSGFLGTTSTNTTGNATSYDDMIGPHYKENALYTTSPQVEASALWVHSRDVSGMQANSYYNVHGSGQHAGYTPSQPALPHHPAGFASYSQGAPSPHNHQLLQQPQVMGNLGSLGTGSHSVMFSQPQRGPLNWASSYSSFIRSQ